MESRMPNQDHNNELSRLNRISGQVDGIKKMIKERRSSSEIITQLRAVASATKSLESILLQTHLEACIEEASQSDDARKQQEKIDECIKIFKTDD